MRHIYVKTDTAIRRGRDGLIVEDVTAYRGGRDGISAGWFGSIHQFITMHDATRYTYRERAII